jgi:multidrug transporter EmrE-like cation transporter
MSSPDPAPRQRPPRKLSRLIVCALGLAANLYLLSLEITAITAGGEITLWALFATVMTGIFAAMLYSELGKPKPPPASP